MEGKGEKISEIGKKKKKTHLEGINVNESIAAGGEGRRGAENRSQFSRKIQLRRKISVPKRSKISAKKKIKLEHQLLPIEERRRNSESPLSWEERMREREGCLVGRKIERK